MTPENLAFGGGVAQTILSPIVIVAILLAGVLICFASTRRALIAFITAALVIPIDQILVLGGIHFPMMRVLVVFGAIRIAKGVFSGGEQLCSGGINGIDKCFMILTVFTAIDGILLWQTSGAFIYQAGNFYTAFGCYFLLRFLVRDEDDVNTAVRTLAFIVIAVSFIMVTEQVLGHNFYYQVLGGARSGGYGNALEMRDGKLRATGVFGHPILAGTFGDFCIPLFIAMIWRGRKEDRKLSIIAVVCALIMPFAANSSTTLIGLMAAIVGICAWPLRKQMRLIRWATAALLVSLHMVMKAPVWQLIARIDLAGGSSADHRYRLINECINHFTSWALIGTKDYPNWGWSMWDLSDQYVGTADTAGLIPLIAFVGIFVVAFRYIGLTRKHYAATGDQKHEKFIWAIGVSVFANFIAFIGIDYFDQTMVAWYTVLAVVSAVTLVGRNAEPVPLPLGNRQMLRAKTPLKLGSRSTPASQSHGYPGRSLKAF